MPNHIDEGMVPNIDYLVFRKCTPSWRISQAPLYVYDVTYVTAGSACYTIDGVDYEIHKGDLFCLPPGHIREAETKHNNLMHCFAVNFELKDLYGYQAKLPFPLISHIGIHKDLLRLYHELVFTWLEKEPGYSIKSCGLFILILHLLFERIVYNIDSSGKDSRVKKVCRYITRHFSEKSSVRNLAALTGLNPVYFGALFKKETGLTVHQYIAKTRVKNGENMLKSGEFTVADVAERCGYSDTFYFYKQFKRIMGFAPSACIPKRGT
jgi:AraC-like DNA-binding protein